MPLTGFGPTIIFAENTVNAGPQLLDGDVVFTTANGMAGGSLTLRGLLAEDRVSILSEGTAAGQIDITGNTVTYGGTVIGTTSGGVGSTFTVLFNTAATTAAADRLIERLAFADVSDAPTATRTLTLHVVDGAGQGLGPAFGAWTALTGSANPFNGFNAGTGMTNSTPAFVDLDGDGDLDFVAGEIGGTFMVWRNTGTAAAPVFTALTGSDNPLDGLDAGDLSTPAFVDLDNDGDLDLVSGAYDGTFLSWRNTGTAAAPVFTALTGSANPFNGFTVGYRGAPAFVDLDRDGDLDLVAGTGDGAFRAWRNTGTAAVPVFTALTGSASPFTNLNPTSHGTPAFVDMDLDGDLDLVAGNFGGGFLPWRNTGTAAAPVYTRVTSPNDFSGLSVGARYSAPAFVDLDNDGDLDLVSGEQNGTFLAWRNDAPLPSIAVTVTAQNDAPTVTSAAVASFAENGTGIAYRAAAADPEGNALTWTLGGTDAALFDIVAATGAVTFKAAPDFETPADAGLDNIYDISVTASDGALSSAARAVAITVTNGNEAPAVTSATSASFAENGIGIAYQATSTDPEGRTITWTLGGTDAARFAIVAATGAVSFKIAPNFEVPTDSGANNIYDITVTASYGNLSGTARAVAITVTNVNEAPTVTSGLTASFAENGIGIAYQATASDPDAGTALTWSLSGTDAARFNLDAATGAVTFKVAPDFEVPADTGADNLYNITVIATDGALSASEAVVITVADVIESLSLSGGNANDVLRGGNGNDTLNGGKGTDTMFGGEGDDLYLVDNAGDVVVEFVGGGNDTVQTTRNSYSLGNQVENLLFTGVGNFTGIGNELNNTVTGAGGNDLLNGGLGADRMIGAAGDDLYLVDNAGDVVVEVAGGGTDTVRTTLASYSLGSEVENLVFISAVGGFTGLGNALNNTLTGNRGADMLDGGEGADTMIGGNGSDFYVVDNIGDSVVEGLGGGIDTVRTTLASYSLGSQLEKLIFAGVGDFTGAGNALFNTLTGGAGNDTLIDDEGNDELNGGAGADSMTGGSGNDTYHVDNIGDLVVEQPGGGSDTVRTTLGSYTLGDELETLVFTGAGHFSGTGNASDNTLTGAGGDDTLNGDLGYDRMTGGLGSDTYVIDSIGDVVVEGAAGGTDTVLTTLASYRLGGNLENLVFTGVGSFKGTGNTLDNALTGGAGNDTLFGWEGNDTLTGAEGNDVMNGGLGADSMTGGAGNDVFRFTAGQAQGDVITDFAGNGSAAGDRMVFEGYGTAVQGANFMHLGGGLWQITSADLMVTETISLVGAPPVHASDYVFT